MSSVRLHPNRPLLRSRLLLGALFAVLIGVSGLSSCRRDPDLPAAPTAVQVGRDYFPLRLNYFWVYDVEDHVWNINTETITRYQFRERVDTFYLGAAGDTTFRIVRSRRPDANSTWQDDSVFAIVRTPQAIRLTAGNIPTIELTFPVGTGRSWNPNAFSARDSTTRTYGKPDQPLTLPNNQFFAQTVSVDDTGENNVYFLREQRSAYARRVGRISRTRRTYDYCQEFDERNVGCTAGTGDFIVRGFERHEYLREYGTQW